MKTAFVLALAAAAPLLASAKHPQSHQGFGTDSECAKTFGSKYCKDMHLKINKAGPMAVHGHVHIHKPKVPRSFLAEMDPMDESGAPMAEDPAVDSMPTENEPAANFVERQSMDEPDASDDMGPVDDEPSANYVNAAEPAFADADPMDDPAEDDPENEDSSLERRGGIRPQTNKFKSNHGHNNDHHNQVHAQVVANKAKKPSGKKPASHKSTKQPAAKQQAPAPFPLGQLEQVESFGLNHVAALNAMKKAPTPANYAVHKAHAVHDKAAKQHAHQYAVNQAEAAKSQAHKSHKMAPVPFNYVQKVAKVLGERDAAPEADAPSSEAAPHEDVSRQNTASLKKAQSPPQPLKYAPKPVAAAPKKVVAHAPKPVAAAPKKVVAHAPKPVAAADKPILKILGARRMDSVLSKQRLTSDPVLAGESQPSVDGPESTAPAPTAA